MRDVSAACCLDPAPCYALAMAEASPAPMTVDEFLVWAEGRPGRYELERQRVLAMSPESVGHLMAKASAFNALAAAIARAGAPCRALPDGATVRIDETTAYEPDALVYCGPRLPLTTIVIPAPIVVVEVVSPSSGRRDHQEKLIGYFAVPSIQHYLIIHAERRTVVHHARTGDAITTRILGSGALLLDPPGLDLAVEDLFGPAEVET